MKWVRVRGKFWGRMKFFDQKFLWGALIFLSFEAVASEPSEFQDLQNFFSKGKYESVISKGQDFETKYPNSEKISQAKNLLGLSYYMLRRPGQAIIQFNQSLERTTDPTVKPFIWFNLASAQVEGQFYDEASQTLALIQPDALDSGTRSKFHLLKAKVLKQQGAIAESVIEAARSTLGMSEEERGKKATAAALELIEQGLASIESVDLLEEVALRSEKTLYLDLILYRLGSRLAQTSKTEAALDVLKKIQLNYQKSSKYSATIELIRSLESQGEVSPTTIGVLLPLSGRYAELSQRVLQAIALNLKIFDSESSDSRLTLAVADSGEDPEKAVAALNDLCLNQHSIAVIGPLLSKGVDLVSKRAQELGVPLLTLTQQNPPADPSTFSFGMTPQEQTYGIAQYAIEKLKIKRFAILYPRDKYGESYSQSFWDAVEELGGEIKGVESYPAGETDFRKWVDRLVGVYYSEARKRELDELELERKTQKITKRNRKTEKYFSLPPIVDFEAVFVPDEPKNLGQVLPTFVYRDVDGVKFLGTAAWHSPELITRAATSVDGKSYFVDALNIDAQSGASRKFVEKFKETYGGQIPGSVEALAYDAAGFLTQILTEKSPSTRAALREYVQSWNYPGAVTGKITVKDQKVARSFPVFTIKNGKFELSSD